MEFLKNLLMTVLKCAIIAIFVGVLVTVVNYFQDGAVDVQNVLVRTGFLFVILSVAGIVVPPVKKIFGEKGKR